MDEAPDSRSPAWGRASRLRLLRVPLAGATHAGSLVRRGASGSAPQRAIMFDKIHFMRHLGEALDSVRKSEYARLRVSADSRGGGSAMRMRLFVALVSLWPSGVAACAFDMDCDPGSKCLKAPGSLYGVCAGGLFPGNKHDQQPIRAPLDLDRTYGNTCSFDTDCGVTNRCIKSSSGIYGVCMRK